MAQVVQAETQPIISCDEGQLRVFKNCQFEGQYPVQYKCHYFLELNDPKVMDYLFKFSIDSNLKILVNAKTGWGNFESDFRFLDTARQTYMKVSLEQNGVYEQLVLKSYTHTRGGRPYFYNDWVFRNCKNVNNY